MRKFSTSLAVLALVGVALPSVGSARNRATPVSPKENPGNWFPPDAYPAEAKRNGEHGRVVVQLTVGTTGLPTACKVLSSSGSASLDSVTCTLAMTNGRFTPAKDARGRPIEATYTTPGVRWELQDDTPIKLEGPWRAAAVLQIDQAGKLASCREQMAGPVPAEMQPCLMAKAMPPAFGMFARGGSTAPLSELVIETSLAFDGVPGLPMVYDADDRDTLELGVTHFDVSTGGKPGNCQVQTQIGPNTDDMCTVPPGPFLPIEKQRGIVMTFAMSRPTAPAVPGKP